MSWIVSSWSQRLDLSPQKRDLVAFLGQLVAFGDLVGSLQLFCIVIFHAQRAADFFDDVLIGGGIIAAGRFVAVLVRVFPICVDVTGGEIRPRFGVLAPLDVLEANVNRWIETQRLKGPR